MASQSHVTVTVTVDSFVQRSKEIFSSKSFFFTVTPEESTTCCGGVDEAAKMGPHAECLRRSVSCVWHGDACDVFGRMVRGL